MFVNIILALSGPDSTPVLSECLQSRLSVSDSLSVTLPLLVYLNFTVYFNFTGAMNLNVVGPKSRDIYGNLIGNLITYLANCTLTVMPV